MSRSVQLTRREVEVILGVVDCKPSKAIADRWGMKEKTVNSHISRLTQKLGVNGRGGLRNWGRAFIESHRAIIEQHSETLARLMPLDAAAQGRIRVMAWLVSQRAERMREQAKGQSQ